MKFYLSSYHICKDPSRLAALGAKNRKVGVIQNALDCYPDLQRRRNGLENEFRDLEHLGLKPEELDLRDFFGKRSGLEKRMDGMNHIWVTGGNSFVLRRAFSLSCLDSILQERLPQDDFVYSGYSAGACVITPTLKGLHLADDPDAVPAGYTSEIIWTGLNFIPYCIAPHYKSNHPESALIDKSVEYFISNKIPFIALSDGESVVLDLKIPHQAVRIP